MNLFSRATTSEEDTTKELVLICAGGIKGSLEVSGRTTLADVRNQIDDEFDEDMIPPDFVFHLNDVRISIKQEKKKLALDFLDKELSIKSKHNNIRSVEAAYGTEKAEEPPSKRLKISNDPSNNEEVVTSTDTEFDHEAKIAKQEQQSDIQPSTCSEQPDIKEASNNPQEKNKSYENNDSPTKAQKNVPGKDDDTYGSTSTLSNQQMNDESENLNKKEEPEVSPDNNKVSEKDRAQDSNSMKDSFHSVVENGSSDEMDIDKSSSSTPSLPVLSVPTEKDGKKDPPASASTSTPTFQFGTVTSTSATFTSSTSTKPSYAFGASTNASTSTNMSARAPTTSSYSFGAPSFTFGASAPAAAPTSSFGSATTQPTASSMTPMKKNPDEDVIIELSDDRKMPAEPEQQTPTKSEDKDTNIENISAEKNPNEDADRAVEDCRAVLGSIDEMLKGNPLFCSNERRTEWSAEILKSLSQTAPKTIIGVLGNTGVGKSSLLNALLDEASVLPTSGSRGCTAAVVELRYNTDLVAAGENNEEVAVYKGEVEFMKRDEWLAELKILVDECSTHHKTVYVWEPDPQRQSEAAAAWAKIDQVYGRGTMIRYKGEPTDRVYNRLAGDPRIRQLLAPQIGSLHPYNVIPVEEGGIIPGSNKAKILLGSYEAMSTRMRRKQKKWAESFRTKINSFVYRKGNGDQPQTWPLIRKVVLYGPWECLSTGACLVDLPGVRDANAARAKVSESYLQNCNQIWVVAPIKRAVDDGTAKELLGEQFKRRLLMDGQYGNVSFICTQTDDCEATEIMRDHSDIAQTKEGRWERMAEISSQISQLEKEIGDLREEEEDLRADEEEKGQLILDMTDGNSSEDSDEDDISIDMDKLAELQSKHEKASQKLEKWIGENLQHINEMEGKCKSLQSELKTLCATVRNEYSTKCLQDDFKDGLKSLYRSSDEEDGDSRPQQDPPTTALPEDFEMDVHCISSNDYLKIQGIKPQSDGPPNTFSKAEDTQIPSLRMFVHEMTSRFRSSFAKSYVNNTSDILERVKLLAVNAANIGSGRSSLTCMRTFEREVSKIGDKIHPLTEKFSQAMETKVRTSLQPALKNGAQKGIAAAMPICESWGSKSRRTKHLRDSTHNGLYWATYQATIRREGVYTSGTAGAIDMNQELCDPMEKEFSVDWQRTMDSALRTHLGECESQVQAICSMINKVIASEFEKEGLDKNRIKNMSNTAGRGCSNAVKSAFAAMRKVATDTQRNLNRSLLPTVQSEMVESYEKGMNVERGAGTFNRMKSAMISTTDLKVKHMFDQSTLTLLKGIDSMVKQLVSLISKTSEVIRKHLEDVYSICWDDQSEQGKKNLDPEMQRKIRACRDALLPNLNKLCADFAKVQDKVGIEREALDLDVMAVESLDNTIQKKMENAEKSGEIIDLCDSDEEIDTILSKLPPAKPMPKPTIKIKADPGADDLLCIDL